MNNLAIFIKEHREKLNISMRKLSELSNVSPTEIHRLENGKRRNPSPPLLKSIANALHVKYEDILIAAGYLDTNTESRALISKTPNLEDFTDVEMKELQTHIDFMRSKRR